ncbi:type I restriction-modification enzyme R subunit C-terminal domain-containing protein [Geminisphaera colitermitum]|uniref:type I restriction endonuclease subunit R n=1 Tax=Geminisphaera colitermitum TaxID=1148786 RepID=UPI000158D24D|nr:type I restriction-modification enzyme R subunit C-terminal domain-containing protein [Geminisphaera colitermitum]
MPTTPEQQARQQIDAMLEASGWTVQDYKKLNPSAARGIALREVPLKTGPCDYLLLVDRNPVGVIEAKRVGYTLSTVAEQSASYAQNLPDFLATLCPADIAKLPFAYESTGVETLFRDERDPHPRSRRVFSFHRPETLADFIAGKDTLRARLAAMPVAHPLKTDGMRACQVEAITNLETSFADDQPRALLKMATGSGKTYTACAFSHRLIKHAGARRILFLVDRANLGKQAKGEFDQFRTPDTARKFTELYNVQHLASNKLDPVARVTICTIQRLYSMLRGEADLAEDLDELSAADLSAADNRPRDVAYNPAIPIETFDFIVIDECHRSIYNLWRQVLEYFDAHLIGLSATPSAQTVAFFNQNLVMDYGHERAVADNVNVGYDVYRIRTRITEHGATIEKGYHVTKRDRQTRALRQQLLDEDLAYDPAQLDRSIVNPSQIRTIIQALRDALATELFPARALVPKTLIFAKDDSHAEEIVHITREVFGRGNDFCKKITYQSKHHLTGKPAKKDDLIAEFRNSPTLRIAVTVDMIATGTDIKALECLVFLRDVRSPGYFEQMKGRGTRVLTPTELQSVSGADARAKTHFIIVDAVGVCESDKTESQPLDKKPAVALEKILLAIPLGKRDDDTLSTLASRLARLERQLTPAEIAAKILPHTAGQTLGQIARALLESIDPDKIAEHATGHPGATPAETTPERLAAAKNELTAAACAPFANPDLREALVRAKRENEQTIDTANPDHVIARGLDPAAKARADALLQSFRAYIEQHQAKITALQILYNRPYKQRLTEKTLKELETKLRDENARWNEETLWNACATAAPERVKGRSAINRFADLIPLVRYALEKQPELRPFAETVQDRFNNWLTDKAAAGITFTPDQLAWLHDIRDHIATTLSIDPDDFDYAPFTQRGGLGKAHQLFGETLPALLEELNEVLVA